MFYNFPRTLLAGSALLFSSNILLAQEVVTQSKPISVNEAQLLESITIFDDRQVRKSLDVPAYISVIDKEQLAEHAMPWILKTKSLFITG